jgi:outer membrane protein assembly factor BamB
MGVAVLGLVAADAGAAASGHWRGPDQNGAFSGVGLPVQWSLDGENLLWQAPYGSRSTPLVMDGRVYLINRAGEGERLQERVMALDLASGELLWEHRFNAFLTDVVAHRLGWANLAGDPATGYVYAHGVQGLFFCFDRDGKVIWSRSLTEEFGRISGYGGRTNTPTVEGDLVLINFLNSSWGPHGRAEHRYLAMDKMTGEVVYWATPGDAPVDTTYSTPVVHTLDGRRVLFAGLADGSVVAMDPVRGERLWAFPLSKAGLNASVVYGNGRVYASHSEENLDRGVMGRVVCLDARTGAELWRVDELLAGYATPTLYGDLLLVPSNSGNLHAIDADTGEALWEFNYGKEAKGSPVVADGKVYVGEVGGAYHILRVSREGCERLHQVSFQEPNGAPIEIFGTPVIAEGRVLLPTRTDIYCIGTPESLAAAAPPPAAEPAPAGEPGAPVTVQLVPAETWVAPGEEIRFRVFGIDAQGRRAPVPGAAFALNALRGAIDERGVLRPDADAGMQAGTVTATLGTLSAVARVRIVPPLPYREDFEELAAGSAPPGWITSPLKSPVEEIMGGHVLRKLADRPAPPFARLRCYLMPPIDAGYTVQTDLMGLSKNGRLLPDMGLINSRYLMILTGTTERTRLLRLVSWAPVPRIIREVEFPWEGETWYTAKLSVDADGGQGRVLAKVWPRGAPEPDAWNLEMVDPVSNPAGSPGLYAYSVGITSKSKGTEVLFDNVEVTAND